MKNKKFIFYTRRDEISKISLFFGPGRHAMSVGPKWRDLRRLGSFGLRLSQMRHRYATLSTITHVSRVGTHRPNEWEGRYGRVRAIHAARDEGQK
jgi:hypothetical protein